MKTRTKVLLMAISAVLLVVSTVITTVAFLTSKTDVVQNTFTFGQVIITLDESDVEPNGTLSTTGERVITNDYHLIPGHHYIKDPTVHVDEDSEDCWLFVKLKNDLVEIIDGKTTFDDNDAADTVYTIEAQMSKNGWTCIDEQNNVWAYKQIVFAQDNIPVFNSFDLVDNADVSAYVTEKDADGKVIGGKTIDLVAYAVQADGFNNDELSALENAELAWASTFGAKN